MNRTEIEYCGWSSNPLRAVYAGNEPETKRPGWICQKITAECANCYAEGINRRFGNGLPYSKAGVGRAAHYVDLDEIKRLLKSKTTEPVFLVDMTDPFGEWLDDDQIDLLIAAVALTPERPTLMLTKRPARAPAYFATPGRHERISRAIAGLRLLSSERRESRAFDPYYPLLNLWLGTSAGTQAVLDRFAPEILKCPAGRHWLSAEPLLGLLEVERYFPRRWTLRGHDHPTETTPGFSWIATGGESGARARKCHPGWVRALRDQAGARGTPFFFKSWGTWMPTDGSAGPVPTLRSMHLGSQVLDPDYPAGGQVDLVRVGKKHAGALLDGREWREFPLYKDPGYGRTP